MTHLEWGLIMVAAALGLGGLGGGPFWYAAGHRRARRDGAWEAELDGAAHRHPKGGRHRQDAIVPGHLLELPQMIPAPIGDEPVGEYGPFPVSDEEYLLLTSPLLPIEFEQHACEAVAIANDSQDASVTAWTAAMAADMNRYITRLIGGTDEQLKEITR